MKNKFLILIFTVNVLFTLSCGLPKSDVEKVNPSFNYIPKLVNAKRLYFESFGLEDSLTTMGKIGYHFVDRNSGESIFVDTFDRSTLFNEWGYAIVEKDKFNYLLDYKGNLTKLPEGDFKFVNNEKNIRLNRTDSKVGILNHNLDTVIDFHYDYIREFKLGGYIYFLAETDTSGAKLFDEFGKELLKDIYGIDDVTITEADLKRNFNIYETSAQKWIKEIKKPTVLVKYTNDKIENLRIWREGNKTRLKSLHPPAKYIEDFMVLKTTTDYVDDKEVEKIYDVWGNHLVTLDEGVEFSHLNNYSRYNLPEPNEKFIISANSNTEFQDMGLVLEYETDDAIQIFVLNMKGEIILRQKCLGYVVGEVNDLNNLIVFDDRSAFSMATGKIILPKIIGVFLEDFLAKLINDLNKQSFDLGLLNSSVWFEGDRNNYFLIGNSSFHIKRGKGQFNITPLKTNSFIRSAANFKFDSKNNILLAETEENESLNYFLLDLNNNYSFQIPILRLVHASKSQLILFNRNNELVFWDRRKNKSTKKIRVENYRLGDLSIYVENDNEGIFYDYTGKIINRISVNINSEVDIVAEDVSFDFHPVLAEYRGDSLILWDRDKLVVKRINNVKSVNNGILYSTNGNNCFYKRGNEEPVKLSEDHFNSMEFFDLSTEFEEDKLEFFGGVDIIKDKENKYFYLVKGNQILFSDSFGESFRVSCSLPWDFFESSRYRAFTFPKVFFFVYTGMGRRGILLSDSKIYSAIEMPYSSFYSLNRGDGVIEELTYSLNRGDGVIEELTNNDYLTKIDFLSNYIEFEFDGFYRYYDVNKKEFLLLNDTLYIDKLVVELANFDSYLDIPYFPNETLIAISNRPDYKYLFKNFNSNKMDKLYNNLIVLGDQVVYFSVSDSNLYIYDNLENVLFKFEGAYFDLDVAQYDENCYSVSALSYSQPNLHLNLTLINGQIYNLTPPEIYNYKDKKLNNYLLDMVGVGFECDSRKLHERQKLVYKNLEGFPFWVDIDTHKVYWDIE